MHTGQSYIEHLPPRTIELKNMKNTKNIQNKLTLVHQDLPYAFNVRPRITVDCLRCICLFRMNSLTHR